MDRLLFLVVALLLVVVCQGTTVSTTVITPFCEPNSLHLALSSTIAYNVAFAWSRHADIHKWSFRERPINGTLTKCADYTYDTRIKLPGTFAQYVTNLMRYITIQKSVCITNGDYVENVHVYGTSVIENLKSISHSRVRNRNLVSEISISYDLPWYVGFLEALASKHIMKSFSEKFEIMSNVVCGDVAS
tara:strand:+ start:12566 stop:13132 length:567 start_codon:yes stop_codon:yes gene_type:complete